MAKTISGTVLFGIFKMQDTYNWTDPTNGQVKPLNSFKVLVDHADGTRSMESISFPNDYQKPRLEAGQAYGFPCSGRVSKKSGKINWTANPDLMPFPAPQLS